MLLAFLFALQSGVTMSGTTPPAAKVSRVRMDCAAFRANKDGSWTSVRATRIGRTSLTAGGTFFPGVQLGGIDVGAELGRQCVRKPSR